MHPMIESKAKGYFDNLHALLVWVSIIYCSHWVSSPLIVILDGTWAWHLFRNALQPFVLSAFFIAVFSINYAYHKISTVPKISVMMLIVGLVFVALEVFHLPEGLSAFTQFKYVFYSKLISNFFSVCLLMAIFELSQKIILTRKFFTLLIYIVTVKAIISMLVSALAITDVIPINSNNVLFSASQAYESTTIAIILMFSLSSTFYMPFKKVLLFINALPMMFFECKGATLIFLIFLMVYFGKLLFERRSAVLKESLAPLILIFILGLVQMSGHNAIGAKAFSSMVNYNNYFSFLDSSIQPKEVIYQLRSFLKDSQGDESGPVDLDRGQQDSQGDESGPVDLDKLVQDLGNQKEDAGSNISSLSEETISAYSRIGSMFLGINLFRQNFLYGLGSHAVYDFRVEGFGVHSFLPLLAASYGLIGLCPFLLFCFYYIYRAVRRTNGCFYILAFATHIFLVMVFVNSFVWWYGLIFIVLQYSPKTTFHHLFDSSKHSV